MSASEETEALLNQLADSVRVKAESKSKLAPLKDEPNALEKGGKGSEAQLLEHFILTYSDTYDFSELRNLHAEVFAGLLNNRLLDTAWISIANMDEVLRVLQGIRLLVRDIEFLFIFKNILYQSNGMDILAHLLDSYAKQHFDDEHQIFYNESIIEIVSIAKRLAADLDMRATLVQSGIHRTIVSLLYSGDAMVLQCSMVALINICLSDSFNVDIGRLDCVEILLRIIQECEESLTILASDLLDLLTKVEENRMRLKLADGIRTIISVLTQKGDAKIVKSLMNTITNSAIDQDMCKQVRLHGGIPLLLSFLSSSGTNMSSSTCNLPYPASVVVSVCTALSQLCLNDDNAYSVRMSNGVYLIGQLLIYDHWVCDDDPDIRENIQLQAFRTLRYVFSVERNRKIFKRLFPAEIFEPFIDVGHYKKDIADYKPLVAKLNDLQPSEIQQIQASLDDINLFKGPVQRHVRDYAVQEMIGKGGFGSVWQVKKESAEQLFAMKELSLSESGLTKEDVSSDSTEVGKEVNILNKLDHPNIVKYYQSFIENDHLYIIMELVDGASLLDHINSLTEKGLQMEEAKIWQIFTQICMALKYIHKDKKIVHRDLTPSNVMINSHNQVKIADFGLARQRKTDASMMKSVVGTIVYSCPEIIQHEFYNEKADIWSLGCILYQMATSQPPFNGSNMLTIARRIVEIEFEPIPVGLFSSLMYRVVQKLISPAQDRPDIIEVISIISEKVVDELNRIALEHSRAMQELEIERQARIKQELESAKTHLYNQMEMDDHSSGSSDSLQPPEVVGTIPPKNRGIWSASPMLTISPRKLRLVNDPISQMLAQLHKLVFASQLPPTLEPDYNRKCVDRYKRALFSNSKPWNLKVELKKLMSGSKDLIDLDFGIDSSTQAIHSLSHTGQLPSQRLTYFELQNMVEAVLHKTNYYEQPQPGDFGTGTPPETSPMTTTQAVSPPQSSPLYGKANNASLQRSPSKPLQQPTIPPTLPHAAPLPPVANHIPRLKQGGNASAIAQPQQGTQQTQQQPSQQQPIFSGSKIPSHPGPNARTAHPSSSLLPTLKHHPVLPPVHPTRPNPIL